MGDTEWVSDTGGCQSSFGDLGNPPLKMAPCLLALMPMNHCVPCFMGMRLVPVQRANTGMPSKCPCCLFVVPRSDWLHVD